MRMNLLAVFASIALVLAALMPLSASAQYYGGQQQSYTPVSYGGPSYMQPIYGSGLVYSGLENDLQGYFYPNYAPVYYVQRPYYTQASSPTYNTYGYNPGVYQYNGGSYGGYNYYSSNYNVGPTVYTRYY